MLLIQLLQRCSGLKQTGRGCYCIADGQVVAQLKTLVPRHVRNMNYTDVACHAVLKLGSCKLNFYEMIL